MNHNIHISHDEIFPLSSKNRPIQNHLKGCEHCRELVNVLRHASKLSKNLKSDKDRSHPSTMKLSETITQIYDGSISPQAAANFSNHVESCSQCFNYVAMTVEESLSPVPEKVFKEIEAYSDISLADKALEAAPHNHLQHGLGGLAKRTDTNFIERLMAALKPQPAFRLATLALLFVLVLVGQKPFRAWRANVNSNEGMTLLMETWTITEDNLRPPGNFSKSMFSIPHSASQSKKEDPELASFQTAIKWEGENSTALRGLATYWYFKGNSDRADSLAGVLLKSNENDFEAWNILGLVHAKEEQVPEALEAFAKALKIKADYREAAYNRALVLQQYDRLDEAKSAWQEYLKIDNRSKWAETVKKRIANFDN